MSTSRNVILDKLMDKKIGDDKSASYREFLSIMAREEYPLDLVLGDVRTHAYLAAMHDPRLADLFNKIFNDDSLHSRFKEDMAEINKHYQNMSEHQKEQFAANLIEARAEKKAIPTKTVSEPAPKHKKKHPAKVVSTPTTGLEKSHAAMERRIIAEIRMEWQGKPPEDRANLFLISGLMREIVELHKGDRDAAKLYYDAIINKSYPLPKVTAPAPPPAKDKEEVEPHKKEGRYYDVLEQSRALEARFKNNGKMESQQEKLMGSDVAEKKQENAVNESDVRKTFQIMLKSYIDGDHSRGHKKIANELWQLLAAKKPLSEVKDRANQLKTGLAQSSKVSRQLFKTTGGQLDKILDGIIKTVDLVSGITAENNARGPVKK